MSSYVQRYRSILQFVPHDTAKLIELQGGAEAFINRLNFVIDEVCIDRAH